MSTELIELYNWGVTIGWRAVDFLVKFVTSPSIQQDYFKLGLILAITFLLEVAARKNWRFRYGSKTFRVDLLYFVFYYGGIYHLLLWTVMYKAMIAFTTAHAPWLQMNLLSGMSPVWQVIVMLLVSDFIGYWSHRWRHSSKTLWNFHSIHHSQTNLTIVSNYRFHVVDETLLRLWLFIPFQILGTGLALWLWLDLILAWILYLQHSEWKWTYGRLGYIFVSPSFHRKHHSTDERLQNSNYSMLFTFWDDLFGTADRKSPIPTTHGIEGNPVPDTWIGQFIYPFAETWRDIRASFEARRRNRAGAAVPPVEPAE